MTATTQTRSRPVAPVARDSFGRLLRSEWTKFRSVRRWLIGMFIAVALTVLMSLLAAAGSTTTANEAADPAGPDGRPVRDSFHFVHQPLAGDGSVTARVTSQADSQAWARAGLMLKAGTAPGAPFASIAVTPRHGVWFQANFTTYQTGTEATAPRWLRLTRSGTTITGYESADGSQWSEVGTVELGGLPETVEVGMFVNSPGRWVVERNFGSSSVGGGTTSGTAGFDNVSLEPARPQPPAPWQDTDVTSESAGPDAGDQGRSPGGRTEAGGPFTVTGSGSIESAVPSDDTASLSLAGVQLGQVAIVAVAVLFITAEFRRGMIRTTFAVSPRRGRVLAAKAIVLAVVSFAVGLVACVAAFLVTQPALRANGFAPPAYPVPSLADGPVLRAVIGSAVYLALIALLALGVGTILRRSAAAIAGLVVLLIVPFVIQGGLTLTAAQWLIRSTPNAGLAIQQPPAPGPFDPEPMVDPTRMTGPWAGLAVLAVWAAAALVIGYWRLRRRDS